MRMEGVKNEEVLGMLSGIMKGRARRVRRGDAGASPREIGGASVGGGGGARCRGRRCRC